MGKIVIIGGGEIKDYETYYFDKRIVELTGKKEPKALFIPTASGEPQGYIDTFQKVYGEKLLCNTDTLYLLNQKPSKEYLRNKILSSDIIYVGGGNTLRMMKRWRFLGLDKILKEAYNRGVVLCGLSAGGICWFDAGHSDSESFRSDGNDRNFIKVRGLGIIKGIHCPHFDGKHRRNNFPDFIRKHKQPGIAIENNCAIEFIDGTYKVLSPNYGGEAYKIIKKGTDYIMEKIPSKNNYENIENLYK